MLKKFTVKIWAYDHYASFDVEAEDNAESIEQSILDKIGEKSINWESAGMFKNTPNRITYEEVIDGKNDATLKRPLQAKEGSGLTVGAGTS